MRRGRESEPLEVEGVIGCKSSKTYRAPLEPSTWVGWRMRTACQRSVEVSASDQAKEVGLGPGMRRLLAERPMIST